MLHNVFTKALYDQRRGLLWWAVGVLALAAWGVGWYGTFAHSAMLKADFFKNAPAIMKSLFGDLTDIATPTGFLRTEIFSLTGPLIFMVFAIGTGASAIASEESRGTLDVLLSMPITRRTIVLQKLGAMLAATFGLAVALGGALIVGTTIAGMHVGIVNLLAQTVAMALLASAFGALALLVGSATGSKGTAVGVASAVAVGAYLFYGITGSVVSIKPWRWLSPFTYYSQTNVIRDGPTVWHFGVLAALTIVAAFLAIMSFNRRDVRT